ncbi:MAG: hypothetical protein KVP17_004394 [Porospora cf. gigantea B]|uniref:uncharacterized protein n=1 Tax=Porospora cf. gigantea B TaxID=2853592 RepID=UPI003571819C|nr:MAG: hypothetical protein KVP17_004394 [Porospora cf. gigantea B]
MVDDNVNNSPSNAQAPDNMDADAVLFQLIESLNVDMDMDLSTGEMNKKQLISALVEKRATQHVLTQMWTSTRYQNIKEELSHIKKFSSGDIRIHMENIDDRIAPLPNKDRLRLLKSTLTGEALEFCNSLEHGIAWEEIKTFLSLRFHVPREQQLKDFLTYAQGKDQSYTNYLTTALKKYQWTGLTETAAARSRRQTSSSLSTHRDQERPLRDLRSARTIDQTTLADFFFTTASATATTSTTNAPTITTTADSQPRVHCTMQFLQQH